MTWDPPPRFADLTEKRIIAAILEGRFPIASCLPAERDLAVQLGVTRPTLREALQRLERDGWLDIQQGKPTRIRNYWQEGNLGVLAAVADYHRDLPPDFVENLLQVRLLLAPAYSRRAIERNAECLIPFLQPYLGLPDSAETYAAGDWELHHRLTLLSENPIFTLILNGFRDLYPAVGIIYFSSGDARRASDGFYRRLLDCAENRDGPAAEVVTRNMMEESIRFWNASIVYQRAEI